MIRGAHRPLATHKAHAQHTNALLLQPNNHHPNNMSSTGRGRGRGRGSTLPAWMTHGSGGGGDGPSGASAGAGGGAPSSTIAEDVAAAPKDDRRHGRERPDGRDGMRGRDDYDRDRGRDFRDRDLGDRHHDRYDDRRRRDGHGDRYRDERDREYPSRDRRGIQDGSRPSGGLGADAPWERDRGGGGSMGRGRGRGSNSSSRDEMNFVRGEVLESKGRKDIDTGLREGGSEGMGRGRGRGRGIDNKPAWMTASDSGPSGDDANDPPSARKEKDNETMELLLAQARQVQQEQMQQRQQTLQKKQSSLSISGSSSAKTSEQKEKKPDEVTLTKQRQLEAEEAAKKALEEQKRLEQQREEEEQRQLLALLGDLDDNDDTKDANGDSTNGKKRRNEAADTTSDDDLFEFETEEEREERLARKRREERRKKLRMLEDTATSTEIDEMKVDNPRNAAGVIQSELEDAAAVSQPAETTMEVDTQQPPIGGNGELQNKPENDSDDDSFDIFAADNSTPVPTTKNATSNATHANATRTNHAQECDDAEGYYKANLGEVITLPKERGDHMNDDEDGADRIARFRVMGLIGKGVFSTVIKCVEVSSSTVQPSATAETAENGGGRILAMKVIRNNEVMAKAAAKEMRILRMLCQPRVKSNNKQKSDGNVENEEDIEEKERQRRENHNIVRLLDVDPTVSTYSTDGSYSSAAFAAPPPEFRSHCIFLFEFLPYNLREVLSKFGKNVGINLTAVRSYGRQLLCALGHLERHRVVHGMFCSPCWFVIVELL